MTAIVAESMLNHLENNGLKPDELTGNCRKSRSTKDQLSIDKMILRNVQRQKKSACCLDKLQESFRLAASQMDCEKPSYARYQ